MTQSNTQQQPQVDEIRKEAVGYLVPQGNPPRGRHPLYFHGKVLGSDGKTEYTIRGTYSRRDRSITVRCGSTVLGTLEQPNGRRIVAGDLGSNGRAKEIVGCWRKGYELLLVPKAKADEILDQGAEATGSALPSVKDVRKAAPELTHPNGEDNAVDDDDLPF